MNKLNSFKKDKYLVGDKLIEGELYWLFLYKVISESDTEVVVVNDKGETKSYPKSYFKSMEYRNPRFKINDELGPELFITDDENDDTYVCFNDYEQEYIEDGQEGSVNKLCKTLIVCERHKMLTKEERLDYYKDLLKPELVKVLESGTHEDVIDFIIERGTTYAPFDEDNYCTYLSLYLDGRVYVDMEHSCGGTVQDCETVIGTKSGIEYFEDLISYIQHEGGTCFEDSAEINFMNRFLKDEIKFKE